MDSKDDVIGGICLTPREDEVLKCICEGNTIQQIAEKMLLSPSTVWGYKSKLMLKTNAKNSAHLVMQAAINNLIEF